ncbi:MAG: flagellar hook-basal body complex protein FliE [Lachnospiraceae bacterium]|nr:flagellar hook-basal body complex protein FliE [Lachnospiraceae bacterium]
MTITAANDIDSLYNVTSDAVKNTLFDSSTEETDDNNIFSTFLDAAVSNINDTNIALSNQENEELKWAMGISENTHDLTIAVGKAETALGYTVALRDKLLDAYQEIMQMQI